MIPTKPNVSKIYDDRSLDFIKDLFMKYLSLLILTLTSPLYIIKANDMIPSEIKPLMNFMAPLSGSAEMVAQTNKENKKLEECIFCEKKPSQSAASLQPIFKAKEDQWTFSVMTTMTAPPDAFKKEYMESTSLALKNELNQIIRNEYSTHNDRLKAISQMCQGKNEVDRIQLASHLGSQLSVIYHYDRTNSDMKASSAEIKPEDQWNALHNRSQGQSSVSGVCRDATFTLTQFLVACGFAKKQLDIQSFKTDDGGHQIVNIRDSNGKLYTINWSELYATPEKGGVAPQPNSGNIFNGLNYTTYDADGKLVSMHRTELGNIIKSVTGGTPDDPNFQPHLLRLEAKFRDFTGNVFKAQTNYGEDATGAAIANKLKVNDFIVLSVGTAFVNNQKTAISSSGKTTKMEQNIIYFQNELEAQKSFRIYDKNDTLLNVRPYGVLSSEFYMTHTTLSKNKKSESFKNMDATITGKMGGEISGQKDNYQAWLDTRLNVVADSAGNTEFTGDRFGVGLGSSTVTAGVGYDGKKYRTTLEMQTEVSHYENRYAVSSTFLNKSANASGSIMYSVYDRGYGQRDDYVLVQAEKNFVFKRVGTVSLGVNAQIPVNGPEDAAVMATLKYHGKK